MDANRALHATKLVFAANPDMQTRCKALVRQQTVASGYELAQELYAVPALRAIVPMMSEAERTRYVVMVAALLEQAG